MVQRLLRFLLPGLLVLSNLGATAAIGQSGNGQSGHGQPAEYEVKAAFLYNFARFSEWPAADDSSGIMRICIIGKDPFGQAFDDIIGRPVRSQVVAVVRTDSVAADDCQLLFVADSARDRLEQILAQVAERPVVTVGDGEDFVRRGGMVGFIIRGRKVRFLINPEAAAKVGIRFSSKLLRVAEIYQDKG